MFLHCNMFFNWIMEPYSLFMVLAVHCIDLETHTWSVMETTGNIPVFDQFFLYGLRVYAYAVLTFH